MCCNTFLIGNTIFNGIYKKLSGTLYSDNGEKSKRNNKSFIISFTKLTVYAACYVVGNIVYAAATAARKYPWFNYLYVKNNGIYSFYYRNRKIVAFCAIAIYFGTEARFSSFTLEYIYVSFATKQNYLLFNNCYAFKFLYITLG